MTNEITKDTKFDVRGIKRSENHPWCLEFCDKDGNVLFMVSEDHFYNSGGNYFKIDVK